ncbi:MAG: SAP domain-containing protein [candidate division Zixibacteria bacterium]|nr:SAP domain-containing protein [candidate division Zixibacteria bacterium]
MEKVSLTDILNILYVTELKDIAYNLDIDDKGNKQDLIIRIVQKAPDPHSLISLLKNDELKAICHEFKLEIGNKGEMIERILGIVDIGLTGKIIEQIKKTPEFIEPTIDNVIENLEKLKINKREIRDEKDAEEIIGDYLAGFYKHVMSQFFIGGNLGLKIDLDIDSSKVGIEVKLSESLLNNTSEMFRLIGQLIFYKNRRYHDNLIIVVVGDKDDLDEPVIIETFNFLKEFGIRVVGIPVS